MGGTGWHWLAVSLAAEKSPAVRTAPNGERSGMVKRGGPCEAPVDDQGNLCGITEISDKSDWRKGKEEHAGKWCCTKAACRKALKVITPKAAAAPPAAAPAVAEQAAARAAAEQAARAAATQQPATTEAAAAAATAAAAAATPPRPAYARYWKELSSAERQAAAVLGHSHTSWDPQVDRESIAALAAQANNGNQWFVEPLSAAAREQQRSSEQRLHFKLWKEMIASERGERIMGAMRAGLDSIQQPYFAEGATEDWYEHFGIAYEYGHGVEIVSPA